jgi:sporulation protein YlmC with PRC-barrel domain
MLNADEILGKTVIGAAGNYIGEVSNIEIEKNTWHVAYLQIKLSDKAAKEFGLKKPLKSSSIKIPTSLLKTVGIIINLSLQSTI